MSQAVSASQSGSLADRQVPPRIDTEAGTVMELRVPQYGEVWMKHVMGGGAVRDGNILVFPPLEAEATDPVIRLDDRTVEFDLNGEDETHTRFNDLLDLGRTVPQAACAALNEMRAGWSHPTDEFIEYLSDGTCQRYFDNIVVKPEWRVKREKRTT